MRWVDRQAGFREATMKCERCSFEEHGVEVDECGVPSEDSEWVSACPRCGCLDVSVAHGFVPWVG